MSAAGSSRPDSGCGPVAPPDTGHCRSVRFRRRPDTAAVSGHRGWRPNTKRPHISTAAAATLINLARSASGHWRPTGPGHQTHLPDNRSPETPGTAATCDRHRVPRTLQQPSRPDWGQVAVSAAITTGRQCPPFEPYHPAAGSAATSTSERQCRIDCRVGRSGDHAPDRAERRYGGLLDNGCPHGGWRRVALGE
jgi:hypothetical protein